MRTLFFPLQSKEEVLNRKIRLAQEFHIYDEQMPVFDFMYMSDKVLDIWKSKKKALESGTVYIGG